MGCIALPVEEQRATWRERTSAAAALISALAVLLVAPVSARAADCLSADPPPVTSRAHALRFGITPQLAGSAGSTQGEAVPEDPAKTVAALHRLEPKRRHLVLRLNRLFWSDGRRASSASPRRSTSTRPRASPARSRSATTRPPVARQTYRGGRSSCARGCVSSRCGGPSSL